MAHRSAADAVSLHASGVVLRAGAAAVEQRVAPGEILRQRVDGVANQVVAFLTLIGREAVGHGERVGFDDDGHP